MGNPQTGGNISQSNTTNDGHGEVGFFHCKP